MEIIIQGNLNVQNNNNKKKLKDIKNNYKIRFII